jgi:hypothetical protein
MNSRTLLRSYYRLCAYTAVCAPLLGLARQGAAAPDEAPSPNHNSSNASLDANGADRDNASSGTESKDSNDLGFWSHGDTRWFISARPELGTPYAKPYVSAGYGKPHWIWAGADLNAISTLEFIQGYAGLRASSPVLDLAFGWRDTSSFGKGWLTPAASFNRADVLDGPGPRARYWAWEGEAVALAPLPYSAIVVDMIAVKTLDVPAGKYVYDESYRVVVKDSLFEILRVGLVARLLPEDALKVGVLSELIFGTGRGHSVVRVGPVASFQLTDHLEAVGGVTFAVSTPDSLGLTLSTYGIAGLRYRWATGERAPKLPWRGRFIPW